MAINDEEVAGERERVREICAICTTWLWWLVKINASEKWIWYEGFKHVALIVYMHATLGSSAYEYG